jgi:predicted AAA+ superfamily ATPase
LLHIVHKIIEVKRDQQFILTGSSARKLKREGVDLLAGRAIIKKNAPVYCIRTEFTILG